MNETILNLNYPLKFWFITISLKRKIGFVFNQMSVFLLLQNNDIDLPNHKEWITKTPQGIVVLETLYAAAQSYNILHKHKDNFTKKRLFMALQTLSETEMQKVTDCWQKSETFGYKKMMGKKKAKR